MHLNKDKAKFIVIHGTVAYAIFLLGLAISGATWLYGTIWKLTVYAVFNVAVIPALVLAWFVFRNSNYRQAIAVRGAIAGCVISIVFNPFGQKIFLDDINSRKLTELERKAERVVLVGKSNEDVVRIFGLPDVIWSTGHAGQARWSYNPMPFFWAGGTFEVQLVDNTVSQFEIDY